MQIIAIIPARGGSKRIPRKNIINYSGRPIIQYSIKQALASKYIDRVIISTDDNEIKNVAIQCGGEVPFLRPTEISQDLSSDFEFFQHCLNWFSENQPSSTPDLFVHLRPTYPNRRTEDIDQCIRIALDNPEYDSVRSVIKSPIPTFKTYNIDDKFVLKPFFKNVVHNDIIINEPYNQQSQLLPDTYWHNGCIDIVRRQTLVNLNSISGETIYPFIMKSSDSDDIDTIDEWCISEKNFQNKISN